MKVQIIFYAKDQNNSTMFYSNLLNKQPILNVPGMTEFELSDNTILGIMPEQGIKRLLGDKLPDPSKGNGIPRVELYLIVDDPLLIHQRAIELGAKELSPLQDRDWGHQVSYCLDLDGNVLAFAKEIGVNAYWDLWRQDDNGNKAIIEIFHSESEAINTQKEFEERKHKQVYWVEKKSKR
jgi:uncharacterized protein